jgi:serine/threonine protein kinase
MERSGVSNRKRTSLQNIFDIKDVKQGTFGLVYICTFRGRASNEAIEASLFAVKTLRDKYLENEELIKKFYREAETWVKLGSNANIVRADYVLEIDEMPHIFMEYVAGGNLRALMQKGHIGLSQALDIGIQFCDGMIYVNNRDLGYRRKGLVHRDIKPENIMLTEDLNVKITDFGLVKALDEVVMGFAGTKEYASPEQFSRQEVDSRSDVYSFGIVFYEMLTGMIPFQGKSFEELAYQHCHSNPTLPTKLSNEIPRELERIILKCLEKKPEDRYRKFEPLRIKLAETYQRLFGKWHGREAVVGQSLPVDRSMLMGISLDSLGKMSEALPWLDEAIKKDPNNVLAWHYKGEAIDRMSKHTEALTYFDEALRIDPKHAPSWSARADALGNLGRCEEAIRCYDKANLLKPMDKNHQFWANKGLAYAGLNRSKEAIECFDKAIEIFPKAAKAWLGKAYIMEKSNRLREAIECYYKALESNPRDGASWLNKGNLHCRLGEYEESIPCFEEALAINPENVATWTSLGAVFANMNRFEKAIRCCDKAIEIDPGNELAKRLRGLIRARI